MSKLLIPESDRLDRHLRYIGHTCTDISHCEPPIHYSLTQEGRRGPIIEPPIDRVEMLLILIVVLTALLFFAAVCRI